MWCHRVPGFTADSNSPLAELFVIGMHLGAEGFALIFECIGICIGFHAAADNAGRLQVEHVQIAPRIEIADPVPPLGKHVLDAARVFDAADQAWQTVPTRCTRHPAHGGTLADMADR